MRVVHFGCCSSVVGTRVQGKRSSMAVERVMRFRRGNRGAERQIAKGRQEK